MQSKVGGGRHARRRVVVDDCDWGVRPTSVRFIATVGWMDGWMDGWAIISGVASSSPFYRVTLVVVVAYLGWVDFNLDVLPSSRFY